MDDLNKNESTSMAADVDASKLAELKAKLEAKKAQESPKSKTTEKLRSINFGICGSGQAGSRLAETFYNLKYDCCIFNTAQQDLSYINIPEKNKFHIQYGLGGAAKSLEIGREAAITHREEISQIIANQLSDAQMFVFCTALGGGSGAGSSDVFIDILSSFGKPILVLAVLPMDSDDVQTKSNALQTLNNLLKDVQSKKIANLFCVDNAKIESLYSNVGQMDFFNVANKVIVEPLDMFNILSSAPSNVKALDSMEFVKLLTDGGGLTTYGSFNIENYTDDTALAEGVIANLNSNLLASGFDITQSRYVGFMLCASKAVWNKIPASSVNFASTMVADQCGNPLAIFKGIYEIDTDEDCVKAYSMFAGLGIPDTRVNQLTKETKAQMEVSKNKDVQRNLALNMDLGKDQVISDAQKVKEKIAAKSSTFGKFLQQTVVDRRK